MFNTLRHKPRHCVTLFLFLARVCTWRYMCTHVYSCLHVCTYVCRCACMCVYISAGDHSWHGVPSLYSLYLMYWGSLSLISKLTISTMDSFLLPSLCCCCTWATMHTWIFMHLWGELNCSVHTCATSTLPWAISLTPTVIISRVFCTERISAWTPPSHASVLILRTFCSLTPTISK